MIEVGAYFYHPIWIQHIQEHKLTDFDDINFSHFPFMNWNASFGCFSEVHLLPDTVPKLKFEYNYLDLCVWLDWNKLLWIHLDENFK